MACATIYRSTYFGFLVSLYSFKIRVSVTLALLSSLEGNFSTIELKWLKIDFKFKLAAK